MHTQSQSISTVFSSSTYTGTINKIIIKEGQMDKHHPIQNLINGKPSTNLNLATSFNELDKKTKSK